MNRCGEGEGGLGLRRGLSKRNTYDDGDTGGPAQDLLHQAVAVVQGLHGLSLVLRHLRRAEGRKRRRLVSSALATWLPAGTLLGGVKNDNNNKVSQVWRHRMRGISQNAIHLSN